jgi:DNA-binding NarL/FixJ family response regulator
MEPSRLARCATELARDAARGEPVLPDVLRLLDRAVGADVLNSSVATPLAGSVPPQLTMLHAPPLTPHEDAEWLRLLPTHPFAVSLATQRPGTARLTDHMSIRELERLQIWDVLLRPRGHRYQVAATLTQGPSSFSLVSLWREDRDFDDAECALVEVVRRALAAALELHAALVDLERLGGPPEEREVLSPRQAQVCALVARGLTNAQVAVRLGITERTVRKHVEDIFARSGCGNRTAVAVWWRSAAPVADEPLVSPPTRVRS